MEGDQRLFMLLQRLIHVLINLHLFVVYTYIYSHNNKNIRCCAIYHLLLQYHSFIVVLPNIFHMVLSHIYRIIFPGIPHSFAHVPHSI